mmetsp:Transcript_19668/g.59464  ORF Transcript_19668/g.59464 Transcript_19668/m.59464 type:complete len:231 (-) Transcript_19668:2229-2921(-)
MPGGDEGGGSQAEVGSWVGLRWPQEHVLPQHVLASTRDHIPGEGQRPGARPTVLGEDQVGELGQHQRTHAVHQTAAAADPPGCHPGTGCCTDACPQLCAPVHSVWPQLLLRRPRELQAAGHGCGGVARVLPESACLRHGADTQRGRGLHRIRVGPAHGGVRGAGRGRAPRPDQPGPERQPAEGCHQGGAQIAGGGDSHPGQQAEIQGARVHQPGGQPHDVRLRWHSKVRG